jgi:hypothetical protein
MTSRWLFPLIFVGLLARFQGAAAQTAPAASEANTPAPKRQLATLRITDAIKLDGNLDEPAWQSAAIATDFIQNRPNPGPHEVHPTEVRVLYDDANIYVGAIMHDVSPDSILREMGTRDGFGNTDFFGVFFDTYRDKLNGYGFFVTPAGVQMDARYSPAGGEDFSWNAVWDSRTALRGTDWVAELRIPYSAIRFSQQPTQLWGLNFMRQRKRDNQAFFWNEVKPPVDGFVNQWGELTGLRDVKPPLRLSLTPYVSAYLDHYPGNTDGVRNTTSRINGGADLKWGINESFTLDATLVPDFGQAQSDNRVLNLTPFEVQYNENRQFFTEGTELFNKGNLFYSRRVGATPIGHDKVKDLRHHGEFVSRNPDVSQLINATKISGRTSKGLGVGVFNAVSREMYATLRDSTSGQEREVLTQPLTNYSIVVLDQSLKNNSYLSLINTNVTRAGQTFDANVTGGLFRFANKANAYAIDGSVVYSRRRGLAFNSEDQVSERDGMRYTLNVNKISGSFTWNVNHSLTSNTYNPNDLGLLFNNNTLSQGVELRYNKYKPFWKVNNLYSWIGDVREQPVPPHPLLRRRAVRRLQHHLHQAVSHSWGSTSTSRPAATTSSSRAPMRWASTTSAVPASTNVGGFISTPTTARSWRSTSTAASASSPPMSTAPAAAASASASARATASPTSSPSATPSTTTSLGKPDWLRQRRPRRHQARRPAFPRLHPAGPPPRHHRGQHGHDELHLHQPHVVQHPHPALQQPRALPRLHHPAGLMARKPPPPTPATATRATTPSTSMPSSAGGLPRAPR